MLGTILKTHSRYFKGYVIEPALRISVCSDEEMI
jgi:hypothetical protein